MSLSQWAHNGWLRPHQTSQEELIEFTRELREAVRAWLQQNHVELLLPADPEP